jgi:ATP-binding cassette subfamily F protein uup
VLITHDRYFLDAVSNEVVELNDQKLFRYKGKYGNFLEQKELRLSMEQSSIDKARNLMTKELEWMRRQPKARGTKARYRIDAFYDLKDKASKKLEQGKLQIEMQTSRLGRKILEIEKLGKSLGGKELIKDFSYTFRRGDRIGIIGKNGMGKSTFLNLITQAMPQDAGTISIGETIKYGYYTQEPLQMNPEGRVIDEISSIADYITIGKDQQVSASKLLEMFLFTPKSQYGVVGKLSGGERRRLQLLKVLMASPNFLILDEPTNDLDIDTLNVLEDFLESYPGCLVIVSHDRNFMDKLVDHIFVFEGAGKIRDFPGNYTDYRDWLADGGDGVDEKAAALPKAAPAKVEEPTQGADGKKKLSFKEQKELETLEAKITELETLIASIEQKLSSAETGHNDMAALSVQHGIKAKELDGVLERYLELAG